MSLFRIVVCGLGLSSIAVIACTSGTGSTGGGGGDATSFIADLCATLAPCCAQMNKPTDGATCRATYTSITAVEAYDPVKGSACLNELHAAQSSSDFCTTFTAKGASCKGAFKRMRSSSATGAKPAGQPCTDDSECAPSTEGDVSCASHFTNGAETKTCQIEAQGKEGDKPCNETRDGTSVSFSSGPVLPDAGPPVIPSKSFYCDVSDGLYCNGTTVTCSKIQGVGGPCSSFGNDGCTKDAYCDYQTKSCVARVPVGSDCTKSSSACVPDAFCTNDTRKCTALLADGASCQMSQQCQSNRCVNTKCESSSSSTSGTLATICGG